MTRTHNIGSASQQSQYPIADGGVFSNDQAQKQSQSQSLSQSQAITLNYLQPPQFPSISSLSAPPSPTDSAPSFLRDSGSGVQVLDKDALHLWRDGDQCLLRAQVIDVGPGGYVYTRDHLHLLTRDHLLVCVQTDGPHHSYVFNFRCLVLGFVLIV